MLDHIASSVKDMTVSKEKISEKILNHALEIIYLLTGEKYVLVMKKSPHCCIHPQSGKVPVKCDDVAMYFSMEEWDYVKGHEQQYQNIITEPVGDEMDTTDLGATLEDGESRSPKFVRNPAGRSPEPARNPAGRSPEPARNPAGRSPEPARNPAGRSPEPARNPAGRSPEPARHPAGRSPEPARHPAGRSPEPARNPAGRSPEPARNPAGRSPEPARDPDSRSPGFADLRVEEIDYESGSGKEEDEDYEEEDHKEKCKYEPSAGYPGTSAASSFRSIIDDSITAAPLLDESEIKVEMTEEIKEDGTYESLANKTSAPDKSGTPHHRWHPNIWSISERFICSANSRGCEPYPLIKPVVEENSTDGSRLQFMNQMALEEKPFRCIACGQTFKYKSSAVRHYSVVHGVKPHQCDECGRRFSTKFKAVVHKCNPRKNTRDYWDEQGGFSV